jgi:hypothetical protein
MCRRHASSLVGMRPRANPTRVRARCGLPAGFVIALLVAPAASATPPLTQGVYGGVIRVGRGAAGVTLGMTRAQVIARLGRPLKAFGDEYMAYENLPPKNPHGLFDIYFEQKRVRMLVISPHSGWRLADGIHIFASGSIGRLMHRFGHRLKPTRIEDGERLYRITERYLGRTVWSEFYVARFGPKASVYGFDMLFPRGG